MSLFKQLLVRCPLRLDKPTGPILVAKVGVCLAQEAAAFKAFPSDTLIFEPVLAIGSNCPTLNQLAQPEGAFSTVSFRACWPAKPNENQSEL